jgi:hypothetical protein
MMAVEALFNRGGAARGVFGRPRDGGRGVSGGVQRCEELEQEKSRRVVEIEGRGRRRRGVGGKFGEDGQENGEKEEGAGCCVRIVVSRRNLSGREPSSWRKSQVGKDSFGEGGCGRLLIGNSTYPADILEIDDERLDDLYQVRPPELHELVQRPLRLGVGRERGRGRSRASSHARRDLIQTNEHRPVSTLAFYMCEGVGVIDVPYQA